MPNLPHRIRRLRYLVSTSSQAEAFAIRKCLHDRYSEAVLPVLESVFDEMVSDDRAIHIPKLELHLKVTSEQELMEVLPELIQQQLREQLQSMNGETIATTEPEVVGQEVTTQQNQFDILLHYLHTGSVPWEAAHAATSDIAVDLKEACHQQWTQLLDYLRHQHEPTPFYFRLMQLIPVEEVLTLVNALSEPIPQAWRTAVVQLMTSVLASQPRIFNQHTQLQLTAAILSESCKRRESKVIPDFASIVDSVLSQQERNQLNDFIASLPASAAILFEQKKRTGCQSTDDSLGSPISESQKKAEETIPSLDGDRKSTDTASDKTISESQKKTEETTIPSLDGDRKSTDTASDKTISESQKKTEETIPSLDSDRKSTDTASDKTISESQEKAETIPSLDGEGESTDTASDKVISESQEARESSRSLSDEVAQSNFDTVPGSLLGNLLYTSSVDGQVFDWRDRQPLIDFYGDSV